MNDDIKERARSLSLQETTLVTFFGIGTVALIGLFLGFAVWLFFASTARAHDWFPPNCCSGFDCRVIPQTQVQTSKGGFVIPGNPEVVPYNSPKIRQTPPEGNGAFALCTKGGKPDGAVICLYIPTWGI